MMIQSLNFIEYHRHRALFVLILERVQCIEKNVKGICIAIAKAQGKYKGRQPIFIDWTKFGQLYEQWKSGAITAVWFQKEMGLRTNTFYRRLREYERRI